MHQSRYFANRNQLRLAGGLLIGIMSALGIGLGVGFGYTVAILSVSAGLVSLGAVAGTIIGGRTLAGFLSGLLLTALIVWVSGIFHFVGGFGGLLACRLVCEAEILGLSCADVPWPAIYAIGSLFGTLLVFCWIVASVVLDEIKFNVDADVTVIVPDKKHQPGDNVVVCVAVSSREDFYFRRGILRLVSWEIVHTKDGPLERVLWSSERRFGNSTRLVSRQEHREEIAVALPKRWETNFIGAFWGVRVTLNIPGAKDIHTGRRISVFGDQAQMPV